MLGLALGGLASYRASEAEMAFVRMGSQAYQIGMMGLGIFVGAIIISIFAREFIIRDRCRASLETDADTSFVNCARHHLLAIRPHR